MVGSRRTARTPKPSKGRKKIEIKRIDNKSNQQVTFSKRRMGLFKKASELCVLCGAQIAIIVFSPVHKIFCFGHPSIEGVIERYLHGTASQQESPPPAKELEGCDDDTNTLDATSIQVLNQQYDRGMKELEQEKKRAADVQAEKVKTAEFWWDQSVDEEGMGAEELEQYIIAIEELMGMAAMKADDLMMRTLIDVPVPNNGAPENFGLGFGPHGFY